MEDGDIRIVNLADARRTLTGGDLRNDVAFQNDVNRLLATLDDLLEPSTDRRPHRS
jgi:hypothetical protein